MSATKKQNAPWTRLGICPALAADNSIKNLLWCGGLQRKTAQPDASSLSAMLRVRGIDAAKCRSFCGQRLANNAFGLWETDGTAAGTFELTTSGGNTVPGVPAISGEAPYGFLPDPTWSLDLTVFNDQVLFVGRSTVTNYDLWTTDGTGAGTKELTGIAGANASGVLAAALTATNSPDFTVYNGEVLFNGLNNAGAPLQSLWTTNGTALGTKEVTGISGAASTGLNPSDMTVFNGKCAIQRLRYRRPSGPVDDKRTRRRHPARLTGMLDGADDRRTRPDRHDCS